MSQSSKGCRSSSARMRVIEVSARVASMTMAVVETNSRARNVDKQHAQLGKEIRLHRQVDVVVEADVCSNEVRIGAY